MLAAGLAATLGLSACSEHAAKQTAKDVAKQQVADSSAAIVVVGVVVEPSRLQALAKPPAKAAAKRGAASRAGKGKASMSTENAKGDTDITWVEEIDIDGDGDLEQAMLLWDDEDRVLFIATQDDVACKSGVGKAKFAEERGGVLIAIFGEGNTHKQPAGSGWYLAYLDAGQCQAQAAGLYGCGFDAQGKATTCGSVTLDEKNDAVTITAQRMR